MANLKSALRTAQPAEQIAKVTVEDIAQELDVVDVRLVHHNKSGNDYMHFVQADGMYLSVKLGKKVNLTSTNYAGKLKELLSDYVIYTGNTLEDGTVLDQPWFSFGPIGQIEDTPTVSFASVFSKAGAKQQLEKAGV